MSAALLDTICDMPRLRIALALVLPALVLAGCGSSTSDPGSGGADTGASGAAGACSYPDNGQASKPVKKPSATPDEKNPSSMVIATSAGDVPITFDTAQAPCTVNSFVSLATQGYFNNTPCHRLTTADAGISVLQCGDPTGSGIGGPGYTIPDELVTNDPRLQPCSQTMDGRTVCTYTNGTIAMAKTAAPNSGGSQFFLIYADSPLPPEYTVFGHTDAGGLKVLKAVGAKGTADGQPDGAPKTPVTITSVK